MFWLQVALSFALWMAYGGTQMRRSSEIRQQVQKIPRVKRGLLAALLFVVGAGILFGGLFVLSGGDGVKPSGMTVPAWLIITLLGLIFVHLQTFSTAMLVSMAMESVTNDPLPTSRTENPPGKSDETPSA